MADKVPMTITSAMPKDVRGRLRTRLRYATRALLADGDEIEVTRDYARIFRRTGWAVDTARSVQPEVRTPEQEAPQSVEPPAPPPDEDLTRSNIRRMRKDELVELLRHRGQEVSEEDYTREQLLEMALSGGI
jgi:hypothetical protein